MSERACVCVRERKSMCERERERVCERERARKRIETEREIEIKKKITALRIRVRPLRP